jgi:quercetin dioxygenase-like cupin family protein
MHWTATAPQVKWSTLAQYENRNSYPIEEEIMTYSVYSHRKLAVALCAALLAGLTAKVLLAQGNPPAAGAVQDEPIKRTVLFRGDLEGSPGKEIVVFIADLAPGAVGAKHYHPGPEFFYVLEGTLAHEPEGGSAHVLKTGTFSLNPDKAVHLVRNPSSTERTRAIDFLIAEKGQPIVVPVK